MSLDLRPSQGEKDGAEGCRRSRRGLSSRSGSQTPSDCDDRFEISTRRLFALIK